MVRVASALYIMMNGYDGFKNMNTKSFMNIKKIQLDNMTNFIRKVRFGAEKLTESHLFCFSVCNVNCYCWNGILDLSF